MAINLDKKTTKISLKKNTDFQLAIDFSGSMNKKDVENNGLIPKKEGGGFFSRFSNNDYISRKDYSEIKAYELAQQAALIDDDGIDIIPFASSAKLLTGKGADDVAALFKRPPVSGGTNTGAAIRIGLQRHQAKGSSSTVLFIDTDGAPNSRSDVADAIQEAAQSVSGPSEFAIRFLIVGEPSENLWDWLTKLDNELPRLCGGKDLVSIGRFEGVTFEAQVGSAKKGQ